MESQPRQRLEPAQILAAFLGLMLVSSSLEAIWYLGIAQEVYLQRIGGLMNAQFDVFVAFLFYLLYSLGAMIFAVRPALLAGSRRHAVQMGGLYGFFCFSAHNLTDLADVKGFSWEITIIDMAWGTFMTACACALAYTLGRCMGKAAPMKASTPEAR